MIKYQVIFIASTNWWAGEKASYGKDTADCKSDQYKSNQKNLLIKYD